MAPLTPEEKVLDNARMQLMRINDAIQTLKRNLETTDPLPSWTSLQSSFVLLSQNFRMVQDALSNNSAFLSSAHVYPNPHFPAQTQELVLQMLLRKKLDPTTEDWVLEGRKKGARMESEEDDTDTENEQDILPEDRKDEIMQHQSVKLTRAELNELWSWAGPIENEMARKMLDEETLNDFTFEEQQQGVENVVTGLRRKLWESDSEDEEDEEIQMTGVEQAPKAEEKPVEPTRPMMPMDTIFRFMSTGKLPTANDPPQHIQRR